MLVRSHQISNILASEKMVKLCIVNISTNEDTINWIRTIVKDLLLNNKASFSIILKSRHYALTIKVALALLPCKEVIINRKKCFVTEEHSRYYGSN